MTTTTNKIGIIGRLRQLSLAMHVDVAIKRYKIYYLWSEPQNTGLY
jgi:hypothetical protein